MLVLTFAVAFGRCATSLHAEEKRFDTGGDPPHLRSSLQHGFRQRAGALADGRRAVQRRADLPFYAMQPYLLELMDAADRMRSPASAAAIVAGAQSSEAPSCPMRQGISKERTTLLLAGIVMSDGCAGPDRLAPNFMAALALMGLWAVVFAPPCRSARRSHGLIRPERARVLLHFSSARREVHRRRLGRPATRGATRRPTWSAPASSCSGAVHHARAARARPLGPMQEGTPE